MDGEGYAFTSSFGSDLTELAIVGAIFKHFNCHTRGCWRIGHHQAGHYKVCRKHHPRLSDKAPTHAELSAHLDDYESGQS
jgi:hypothetical protein